ncbi:Cytochrome P450 [Popillia japonica]|uniref:Cytochrome P450 n=1 Tax=Popillia japonica TaxID=7064 RepID=A0AAW1MEU1_POPJA
MFTEIIFALASLAFAFVIYFKWKFSYWQRRKVPQLDPVIPWGTDENPFDPKRTFHTTIKDNYDELKRNGHKFGGLYLGTRPALLLVDLDITKKIINKDFQFFSGHGLYVSKNKPALFHNLFSMDGQEWKNSRIQLTPTFTSGKMKMMFPTILNCVSPMVDHINGLDRDGKVLNIKEIVACYSTDVIGSCAFGVECNCFEKPDAEFRKYGKLMLGGGSSNVTLKMLFNKYMMELGLKKHNAVDGMMNFFDGTFKSIFKYRQENDVKRNDFVELLMEMQRKDPSVTVDQMAAHSFMIFLAGFETSSTTLTFCLFELAFNPDIQQKAREDINNIMKKHNDQLTYDAINEMKYLQMVVDETLRKHPPGTTLNRLCNTDYKIEDSDIVIEKDTLVLVSVLGIHRDPEFYPNPDKFDPERFNEENKAQRHQYAYVPFSEGPRLCIGLRFALMQIKIALSYLLRNFEFRPDPSMSYNMTEIRSDANQDRLILSLEEFRI